MIAMAKKKPNNPDDARPNRTGKPLHAWVREVLIDELRKLAKRNRRTITAELEMALEQHLENNGVVLPPHEEGNAD